MHGLCLIIKLLLLSRREHPFSSSHFSNISIKHYIQHYIQHLMNRYLRTREDDDLCGLEELTEESILNAVAKRFNHSIIYTNVSDMLIAINPCHPLPSLYEKEVSFQYLRPNESRDPPHVFSLARKCYFDMQESGLPQVCVVSGESGAGKTESTKLFVRQILTISKDTHPTKTMRRTDMATRINQVNPVLEAFGNAKTTLNPNSSRFGKYLQLQFKDGAIVSATVSQYLLEKARVVHRSESEENFHVFYYLVHGLPDHSAQALSLFPKDYHTFLYNSESTDEVMHRSTTTQFQATTFSTQFKIMLQALFNVGFTTEELNAIFKLVAAIIHSGDIHFGLDSSSDTASVSNPTICALVASLLGIDPVVLELALTYTISITRGEEIKRGCSLKAAQDRRNTMAKEIYSRVFEWIVIRINEQLSTEDADEKQTIGVLDIFGFENMSVNSFEQCCINLANEQLQHYFNQNVFEWEIRQYKEEGINTKHFSYTDNTPIIDMFLKRHDGIFDLLVAESFYPGATATSFTHKLTETWKEYPFYSASKINKTSFIVKHFAGDIEYTTDEFLIKNRDPFPEDVRSALEKSELPFLQTLFSSKFQVNTTSNFDNKSIRLQRCNSSLMGETKDAVQAHHRSNGRRRTLNQGKRNTLALSFKNSLDALMKRMLQCQPVFIRCVKPNKFGQSGNFQEDFVQKQLRYTGVMEAVRIRTEGYPFRPKLIDFIRRFGTLRRELHRDVACERTSVAQVLSILDDKSWRMGKTRVFLKSAHVEALTYTLHKVSKHIIKVQSYVKRFIHVRRYKTLLRHAGEEYHVLKSFFFKIEISDFSDSIRCTDMEGQRKFHAREHQKQKVASQLAALAVQKRRSKVSLVDDDSDVDSITHSDGSSDTPVLARTTAGKVMQLFDRIERQNSHEKIRKKVDNHTKEASHVVKKGSVADLVDRLSRDLSNTSVFGTTACSSNDNCQLENKISMQNVGFSYSQQASNASISTPISTSPLATKCNEPQKQVQPYSDEEDAISVASCLNQPLLNNPVGTGINNSDNNNNHSILFNSNMGSKSASQANSLANFVTDDEKGRMVDKDGYTILVAPAEAMMVPPQKKNHFSQPEEISDPVNDQDVYRMCAGARATCTIQKNFASMIEPSIKNIRGDSIDDDGYDKVSVSEKITKLSEEVKKNLSSYDFQNKNTNGNVGSGDMGTDDESKKNKKGYTPMKPLHEQIFAPPSEPLRSRAQNITSRPNYVSSLIASNVDSTCFTATIPAPSSSNETYDNFVKEDEMGSRRSTIYIPSTREEEKSGKVSASSSSSSHPQKKKPRRSTHLFRKIAGMKKPRRHTEVAATKSTDLSMNNKDDIITNLGLNTQASRGIGKPGASSLVHPRRRGASFQQNKPISFDNSKAIRLATNAALSSQPTISKDQSSYVDFAARTLKEDESLQKFLEKFEKDQSTRISCPVEGCPDTFSSYAGIASHVEDVHVLSDLDNNFHPSTLSFVQTPGTVITGEYYEGSQALYHFESSLCAIKFDVHASSALDASVEHVNLSNVRNSSRSDRTDRIRKHIGSGVLITVHDKSVYITRIGKNPIYINTPIPPHQVPLLKHNRELPQDVTVCVFDYQMFRVDMHKISPRDCWKNTTIKIRLVRNIKSSEGGVWLKLRPAEAIMSWERLRQVCFTIAQGTKT
eukprot:m.32595 g.32595  ORF g.32595 m.32595 type:complete len:1665 (+) comp6393_c0_seq1:108-5102(+)